MPKHSDEDLSRVPICASDFLQEVTIELGKRLKTIRYRKDRLEFRAKITEHYGQDLECFDAIRSLAKSSYIQVVLLENGEANYMYREPLAHKHDHARYIGFAVVLKDWEPCQVANLIRDSLIDEIGIREVWQKLNPKRHLDTLDIAE